MQNLSSYKAHSFFNYTSQPVFGARFLACFVTESVCIPHAVGDGQYRELSVRQLAADLLFEEMFVAVML